MCELSLEMASVLEEGRVARVASSRGLGEQQTGESDFHHSYDSRAVRPLYTWGNVMSREADNTISVRDNPPSQVWWKSVGVVTSM